MAALLADASAARSALSHAAKAGHLGSMRLLISKRALVSCGDGEICSPVFAAIIETGTKKDIEVPLMIYVWWSL